MVRNGEEEWFVVVLQKAQGGKEGGGVKGKKKGGERGGRGMVNEGRVRSKVGGEERRRWRRWKGMKTK